MTHHISTVYASMLTLLVLTAASAPCVSSDSTMLTWPQAAAAIKAVEPCNTMRCQSLCTPRLILPSLRHWLAQTGISPHGWPNHKLAMHCVLLATSHSCTLHYRYNTKAINDQYHICGSGGCYVYQTLALQQQRAIELCDKHRVCVSVCTDNHGVSVYSLKCGISCCQEPPGSCSTYSLCTWQKVHKCIKTQAGA